MINKIKKIHKVKIVKVLSTRDNSVKILAYCKARIKKANKFRFVNFWTFIALQLIEESENVSTGQWHIIEDRCKLCGNHLRQKSGGAGYSCSYVNCENSKKLL